METTNNNKISYVRKPLARRSFMSVGLAAAGLVLFAAGIPGAGAAKCRRGGIFKSPFFPGGALVRMHLVSGAGEELHTCQGGHRSQRIDRDSLVRLDFNRIARMTDEIRRVIQRRK